VSDGSNQHRVRDRIGLVLALVFGFLLTVGGAFTLGHTHQVLLIGWILTAAGGTGFELALGAALKSLSE